MWAFFWRVGGSSSDELESGMCLSKTASVSACVLEVGVGKPSVG